MNQRFRVDLHVHSSEYSECARSTAAEQIAAAKKAGLHGIAFTDHHAQRAGCILACLNRENHPLRVYAGAEISADGEDWVVAGVLHRELSRETAWSYPELHRFVRKLGGWIMLAHPFRYANHIQVDLKRFRPDAIEYRSRNIAGHLEKRILALAADMGLPAMNDSDAHSADRIGEHGNLLPVLPANDQELLAVLFNLPPGAAG